MGASILEPFECQHLDRLMSRARQEFHAELDEFGVTIKVLRAVRRRNKDGEWVDGALLPLRGFECAAIIRSTKYVERVCGMEDVLLVINGESWPNFDADQQLALLDHELTHLEVARDAQHTPLYDDLNRVRLKTRRHDFELGGFHDCVERHGRTAIEAAHVRLIATSPVFSRQQVFNWDDFEARDAKGGEPNQDEIDAAVARVEASKSKQHTKRNMTTAALAPAKTVKLVTGKGSRSMTMTEAADFIADEATKAFKNQRARK